MALHGVIPIHLEQQGRWSASPAADLCEPQATVEAGNLPASTVVRPGQGSHLPSGVPLACRWHLVDGCASPAVPPGLAVEHGLDLLGRRDELVGLAHPKRLARLGLDMIDEPRQVAACLCRVVGYNAAAAAHRADIVKDAAAVAGGRAMGNGEGVEREGDATVHGQHLHAVVAVEGNALPAAVQGQVHRDG